MCQRGSATTSARRAIAGSAECSRGSPMTAAHRPTANAPTRNSANRGRWLPGLMWRRLAALILLLVLAELPLIRHVGARLADRDEVQHGKCDRPDDDLGMGVVRRAEDDEQQR